MAITHEEKTWSDQFAVILLYDTTANSNNANNSLFINRIRHELLLTEKKYQQNSTNDIVFYVTDLNLERSIIINKKFNLDKFVLYKVLILFPNNLYSTIIDYKDYLKDNDNSIKNNSESSTFITNKIQEYIDKYFFLHNKIINNPNNNSKLSIIQNPEEILYANNQESNTNINTTITITIVLFWRS